MNTTVIMAAFVFACANAFAQKAPKDFYIGVRGGMGTCFFVNADDRKADSPVQSRLTFGGGGGIAIGDYLTPHFGFEAQVLYVRQGQNYRIKAGERDSSVSLTFLKVPLMFQYTTDRSKRIRFLARLGPQISFLTAATRSVTGGTTYSDVVIPPRLTYYDLFNTTDLSVVADAGVDCALNDKWSLQAVFRGEMGVVDAEDRTLKAPGRATTLLSGAQLQIGLSYTFNPLNLFSTQTSEKDKEKTPKVEKNKTEKARKEKSNAFHVPVE